MLYLTEPVDEYCIQSLPNFEGKKFQNVAKEGLKLDQSEKAKEYKEKLEKEFEPLLKWLTETALKDKVGGGPSGTTEGRRKLFFNLLPVQKQISLLLMLWLFVTVGAPPPPPLPGKELEPR